MSSHDVNIYLSWFGEALVMVSFFLKFETKEEKARTGGLFALGWLLGLPYSLTTRSGIADIVMILVGVAITAFLTHRWWFDSVLAQRIRAKLCRSDKTPREESD